MIACKEACKEKTLMRLEMFALAGNEFDSALGRCHLCSDGDSALSQRICLDNATFAVTSVLAATEEVLLNAHCSLLFYPWDFVRRFDDDRNWCK